MFRASGLRGALRAGSWRLKGYEEPLISDCVTTSFLITFRSGDPSDSSTGPPSSCARDLGIFSTAFFLVAKVIRDLGCTPGLSYVGDIRQAVTHSVT